jgi:hypothetical protein
MSFSVLKSSDGRTIEVRKQPGNVLIRRRKFINGKWKITYQKGKGRKTNRRRKTTRRRKIIRRRRRR